MLTFWGSVKPLPCNSALQSPLPLKQALRYKTHMHDQWAKISENLKKMLDPGIFKVWITPLHAQAAEGELRVVAPNGFVAGWLESRMIQALRDAAAPVFGLAPDAVRIVIETADAATGTAQAGIGRSRDAVRAGSVVGTDDAPEHKAQAALSSSAAVAHTCVGLARQQSLPLPAPRAFAAAQRTWRFGFEDLVVGPSNSVAVAAARDVCRSEGSVRTLFVNSASGLGKTHLAQAVGRTVTEEGPAARVAYLTAEDFAARFVAALRGHDVESFKSRLRDLDVLLLEDVHFFQGKEKMQDMALTVVKSLQDNGGRVIFTSSFSPRELQQIDSRLVSYFCSGILTDMSGPTEEMRRDILRRKAKSFQVLLPDSVCDLLAGRLQGDVRRMESCLDSLIFKARLLNCGLSVDLALDVLGQYAGVETLPDLEAIIRLVCRSYGLTGRQLCSRSRRQECVLGRNTIYYLARKHTELSLEEIGEKFNRRHSTVIKGITSVERELSRESGLGRQIARAVALIERNAGVASQA